MHIPVRPRHVLNAALSIFLVAAIAAMRSPVGAAAPQAAAQPQRSVAEGMYTQAQRTRGQQIFAAECADCHGADLTGSDTAPSLSGLEFAGAWKGASLGELFEKIGTMPPTSPGKLNPQQSADVLSFVISRNSFPAGQAELPRDLAALKGIRFEEAKHPQSMCRFRTARSSTGVHGRAEQARPSDLRPGVRELPRSHARRSGRRAGTRRFGIPRKVDGGDRRRALRADPERRCRRRAQEASARSNTRISSRTSSTGTGFPPDGRRSRPTWPRSG